MNAKLIMECYGVACAILLPVCLVLVILMARKGGPIDRFNKWFDNMFVKKEKLVQKESLDLQEKYQESEWEINSKTLTCLRLKVGESYRCVLNDTEKYEVGSQRVWSVSEPFVGKIDENTAVFVAQKTGKTYVNCGDVRIYYIEIEPKDRNWFAAKDYTAFIEGMLKSDLMCLHNSKKIKSVPSTKQQLFIKDIPLANSATAQFDKDEKLYRICFKLNNTVQNLQSIETGLQERMEQIKTNIPDLRFWIHKQGTGVEEFIDYAAFVMVYNKQTIMFGIGHNWRQKGTAEEFCSNPAVFIHTFKSILDIDELPEIFATIEDAPQSVQSNISEPITNKEEYSEINDVADIIDNEVISNNVEKVVEDFLDKEWDSDITDNILDEAFRDEERQLEEYN